MKNNANTTKLKRSKNYDGHIIIKLLDTIIRLYNVHQIIDTIKKSIKKLFEYKKAIQ